MTRSEVQQTNKPSDADEKLARRLILDELFDLSLYQSLRDVATGELRAILEQLIPIETRHFEFWQDFFDLHVERLNPTRRLKLALIVAACRLLGASAIHLVLEAIEVYGVRKYLKVWTAYGNSPLGPAVRSVLVDEFKHEDTVVTGDADRRLNPERVRNIFLGLNDGLVEGGRGLVDGSWGVGRFLGESAVAAEAAESPLASAFVVGLSYLAGALVPVLPVLGGARTALPSLFTAGSLIIIVSMLLAFLSGMDITRRVVTNLVIIAAAVGVTFAMGLVTKLVWGVSL